MNLKKFLCLMLIGAFVFVSAPKVFADATSDAILKLLIKKGLITEVEVNEIKAEVSVSSQVVTSSIEERVEKLENAEPGWVRNMRIKGDIRLRNEYKAKDLEQDNNKQRIRFRLGATTVINDKVKAGFGFGTGSSAGLTSTNQTLESEFESKQIWIDYAYVKYEPTEDVTLIGGKFKSPFFHTDMLWKGCIRFDGFAAKVSKELLADSEIPTKGFITAGYFPIDDKNSQDEHLLAVQIGTESKFNDGYAKLKTGLTYYSFENMKGLTPGTSGSGDFVYPKNTNTVDASSKLAYEYQVLSPIVEVSFKDLLGTIDVPWALFGEYANNLEVSKSDEAWRLGLRLGKAKAQKKNDWKIIAQYSRLEKDAFLELFPDTDFNGGGTDGKGWELIFDYVIADNVILSLDYYNTERISSSDKDEQILQTDVTVKF